MALCAFHNISKECAGEVPSGPSPTPPLPPAPAILPPPPDPILNVRAAHFSSEGFDSNPLFNSAHNSSQKTWYYASLRLLWRNVVPPGVTATGLFSLSFSCFYGRNERAHWLVIRADIDSLLVNEELSRNDQAEDSPNPRLHLFHSPAAKFLDLLSERKGMNHTATSKV